MQDHFRALLLAAIVLFSGIAGVAAAYDNAATEEDTVSVEITVVQEQPIDLPGTDVRNETVTLNGTELERGTDYRLDERRGHIWFDADGATNESDVVQADYEAAVPTDMAEHVRGPVGTILMIAGAAVFVLLASLALAGVVSLRGGR